jgi:glycine cleavage system H lipoate-binding protein
MTEFTLPELGENIASGDVVRVLVRAGDTLQRDQAVLELETDKATIEVPSSVSGVVREMAEGRERACDSPDRGRSHDGGRAGDGGPGSTRLARRR